MMRPSEQLIACLQRLGLLFCLALLLGGCGKSVPLSQACDAVQGSCLALSVTGSGSFALLRVRATTSSVTMTMPMATGSLPVTLPVLILLTPPPGVTPSQIQSLSVDALDATDTVQRTGSTSVSWSDGAHSGAVVDLGGTGGPPSPVATQIVLATYQLDRAGDFNGDGKQDFMDATNHVLTVYLNNGQGGFVLPGTDTALSHYTISLLAADVNGDKKTDIISLGDARDNVVIALANGDGSFTMLPAIAIDPNIGNIAVGDFIGDGNLDLMVGYENMLIPWMGNGKGMFVKQPTAAATLSSDFYNQDMVGIDIAIGAKQGVAVISYMSATLADYSIKTGLSQLSMLTSQKVGMNPTHIYAGDFDNDGLLDVTLYTTAPTLSAFKNQGNGTLQLSGQYPGDARGAPVVFDFNRDGMLDLAVNNIIGGTSILSPLAGGGTIKLLATVKDGTPLVAIDLDQSGKQALLLQGSRALLVIDK